MAMPATISSTTDGRRTRGNNPSTSGAKNATATTMNRFSNEGMRSSRARAEFVTAVTPTARAGPAGMSRGGELRELRDGPLLQYAVDVDVDLLVVERDQPGDLLAL